MSNHIHLLLSTPEANLDSAMRQLGQYVTRTHHRETGRSGRLFGGPYYQSMIRSSRYYGVASKYVIRNPARAGLVDRVEDYAFSTLRGVLGEQRMEFPLTYPEFPIPPIAYREADLDRYLDWMNQPFRTEEVEMIRMGLKKKIFELPKQGNDRKPVEIGEDLEFWA